MSRENKTYVRWVSKAEPSDLFPYAYHLHCIKSIEELKLILSNDFEYMAFDTETTGLDQEKIDIVGYSICFNSTDAYYIPVNHYNFGLGEESLDLIYDRMCKCKAVYMYNMRFDVRVMEYHRLYYFV